MNVYRPNKVKLFNIISNGIFVRVWQAEQAQVGLGGHRYYNSVGINGLPKTSL